jgi:hypothetical protein
LNQVLDSKRNSMSSFTKGFVAAASLLATAAFAQQFVYPAKGQSAEQQKKDEYECHQWAVQQTGFDPSKPASAPAAAPKPATTPSGTTPGARLRGAARGAVVGEIVGDDAGTGAAAGAAAARAQSRRQNAAQAQQQQAAAQQAQSGQQATYGKARAACLEGRGYSVK